MVPVPNTNCFIWHITITYLGVIPQQAGRTRGESSIEPSAVLLQSLGKTHTSCSHKIMKICIPTPLLTWLIHEFLVISVRLLLFFMVWLRRKKIPSICRPYGCADGKNGFSWPYRAGRMSRLMLCFLLDLTRFYEVVWQSEWLRWRLSLGFLPHFFALGWSDRRRRQR